MECRPPAQARMAGGSARGISRDKKNRIRAIGMKALHLSRLNVCAPYSVWEIRKQTYGFKTDYGVLYKIEFSDNTLIWRVGAYEFSISNENNAASPNDAKVKDTVAAIIVEFFACNPDILLYQCETGDNKQDARGRLFLRWFNSNEFSSNFHISTVMITAEGINNYAAMIVQKSNPNLDSIIEEFENFVGILSDKPC